MQPDIMSEKYNKDYCGCTTKLQMYGEIKMTNNML